MYGQNEWQRLCVPIGGNEAKRLVRFRTELLLSPIMEQTCDVVFNVKPFPVRDVQEIHARAKLLD